MIAVVIPLWANYLVRVFAWKAMLAAAAPAEAFFHAIGLTDVSLTGTMFAMWLTFCYLWLPFAILPIYASLERVPDSLIDASGDLGAHTGTTFRRVVLPLACRGSSPARSSRSPSRWVTTSFPHWSGRVVLRQRDRLAVREQPAARGNDRAAPADRGLRLPRAREAHRRVRGALDGRPGSAAGCCGSIEAAVIVFLYVPLVVVV